MRQQHRKWLIAEGWLPCDPILIRVSGDVTFSSCIPITGSLHGGAPETLDNLSYAELRIGSHGRTISISSPAAISPARHFGINPAIAVAESARRACRMEPKAFTLSLCSGLLPAPPDSEGGFT